MLMSFLMIANEQVNKIRAMATSQEEKERVSLSSQKDKFFHQNGSFST